VHVVGRTFRDAGVQGITFHKHDLSGMAESSRAAGELPVEELDAVFLTTGIIAPKKREVTKEGIEVDVAISALNRDVIMKALAPRLKRGARVFIVGFPGVNQKANVEDLNSEKKYEGGLGEAHWNTVAMNEVLVVHWAEKLKDKGVGVYGLNPGLVKTMIRTPVLGNGILFSVFESLAATFVGTTPDKYAAVILPLAVAPELTSHSGAAFNAKADPILISKVVTDDHAYVSSLVAAMDALEAKALAAS